jgi:hypothetical protein
VDLLASNYPAGEPDSNTHALILEARRNGEAYLSTQMQLAIAADQRAMTLGSILAAAASIMLGFAFSEIGGSSGVTVLFLLVSSALALACGLAFYSARPVPIKPLGNEPSAWYGDLKDETPIIDALRDDLAVIQRSIESNLLLMAANGRVLKLAMVISGSAVLAAPILALLIYAARCQ